MTENADKIEIADASAVDEPIVIGVVDQENLAAETIVAPKIAVEEVSALAPNPFRPRKLRIMEAGWESYTGYLGPVEFVNAVSVHPVSWLEQQRIGGILRIESAEESEANPQIGPTAELVRGRELSADHERVENVGKIVMVDGEARLAVSQYTREELEDIADRKGINGLRDIAAGWGVRGRSINELILGIMKAQEIGSTEPVPGE